MADLLEFRTPTPSAGTHEPSHEVSGRAARTVGQGFSPDPPPPSTGTALAAEGLPSKPLPEDATARSEALDTCRSFIVEAPAGSGKTGLLVQRFLNLLGSPDTSAPEEILAITFTRKATAELRERILSQLEAAAADSPLSNSAAPFDYQTRSLAQAVLARDRERGWNLLSSPRRLRIQTIDSLCIEIAATLPLLSGVAARTPTDDPTELYREAARSTLRQLGGPDRALHNALHTVLLHRDGSLADVESLLAEMLATREQWAELVPLDRASLTDEFLDQQVRLRLERTLEHVVCAGLTRALKAIGPSALAELAAFAHEFSTEPGYEGKSSPIVLCTDHPGPPAAEAAHLDHWHALINLVFTASCGWRAGFNVNQIGFPLTKAAKERLKNLIQNIQCEPLRETLESVRQLPAAKYPDDQWHHAKALFRLLLHALAELRLLFSRAGQSDFTEFSLAARQALRDHADDFASSSGAPLRHLLVDEMQDTSSAQYDLLTALTRTWDGASQTLFLVGDPKQSIYLFRQARVERFLRTTRDRALGDVPLQALQLTANFRSRPAVVEGVNRDFSPLFPPPGQSADTADVPFVAATPTRPPAPASGVHWHTRIQAPQATSQNIPCAPSVTASSPRVGFADARSTPTLSLAASSEPQPTPIQQDAQAIRRIVERWRSTPLPPGRTTPWRIAVLAYSRRHLEPVVAEFSRSTHTDSPIPYRALKVERLKERPEVLDALALTRALHHPADRTAWFSVLRAPWCGLDAADLLTLSAEGNPAHTKSTVPQLVENHAHQLSPSGKELLNRVWPTLQQAAQTLPRNSLSSQSERTWRALGGEVFLDSAELANIQRYFDLLRDVENGTRLDRRKLNRRLKDLYAEPAAEPYAVELTTIHNAKGLEWDVVIVPELGRKGRREDDRLLNWLELELGGDPAVLLAPIHAKGDSATGLYQWLTRAHARRAEAERRRIFYVACTRAREELHLFATAQHGAQKLSAAPGSLLHACWPAAEPHFAKAQEVQPTSVDALAPTLAQLQIVPSRRQAAEPDDEQAPLALAAEADTDAPTQADDSSYLPRLTRLPLSFDPVQRFREAAARRLPYTSAADLPRQAPLARPEGSVTVRALGNVVHRFLELIAIRLATSQGRLTGPEREARSRETLKVELPSWLERLTASLRAEGLAPAEAAREATRALTLLSNTLADPVGLWLLSPHPDASSERALATPASLLRVDRTFRAGTAPLSVGEQTIWIVDFKTTEPGGRSPDTFLAAQREIYGPQLARYADALRAATRDEPAAHIQLGLYFPAIPRLIHWPASPLAPT